jgi:FtsP/CotA-like multicopper oxidase with cupredoxin domain
MLTRRQFLKRGAVGAGLVAMPSALLRAAPVVAAPPFAKVPRFTVPLPIPVKATAVGPNMYHITQRQTRQILHPHLGQTTVWGYDDGTHGPLYPGPTIEVQRGTSTTVIYENQLPTTHLLPVDTSLVPEGDATVRALTHLHGGFVSGADDGNPYDTPFEDEYRRGETQTVTYPNQQPATTLWYHDHAVAITRLNVYAGLAAYYLIRDSNDTGHEPNPIGIPGGMYEIPIAIQDRTFTGDGQLFYPGPSWVPELFGNTVVVNGAPFPFLTVEPRKYRFRFLNGSNSRFYHLHIAGGPPFHHIGAEGGMFNAPVRTNEILMLPAERADVIVDFAGFRGQDLVLRNIMLPAGVESPASPNLPVLMLFRVGTTVTTPGPATIPTSLPGSLPSFGTPARAVHHARGGARCGRQPDPVGHRRPALRRPREHPGARREHRGLAADQPDGGHAPDPPPPAAVPGREQAPVRRRRLPGGARGGAGGRRPEPGPCALLYGRATAASDGRPRLQGHGVGEPGSGDADPLPVQPAAGRDRDTEVRVPLPHPRARGQRHDAAL